MRKLLIGALVSTLLVFSMTCAFCQISKTNSVSKPVSHKIWNTLLAKHVKPNGWVDYKGFVRDSLTLNQYLSVLESAHPNNKNWSKDEQMAYWINAYNAYTVKLIVQHYPVKSIKDIKKGIAFVNSVWDIKFIKIEGKVYDLNNIEHGILRKDFKDARVHAAVNCASYSCPALRNEAFTAENLDAQLTDAMRKFVNDPIRNKVTKEKAQISEIFKWFSGDFVRDAGSVKAFINRYAETKIGESTPLSYFDYQWSLNEAK